MKTLIALGLMLAILVPLGASSWYVPKRLATLLSIRSARRLCIVWTVLLFASAFAMPSLATPPSAVAGVLYIASGLIFMAHLYLCVALLLLHALHNRLRLRDRLEAWGAIAVAVAITALGFFFAGRLDVERRQISVRGLEQALTVMHVSDVHIGHHRGRDFLQRVVDETNASEPDLVIITGDLLDGNVALDPEVLAPLAELEAPAYFVAGNHEYYIDTKRALQLIAEQGVRVLSNEVAQHDGVQIVGLDYMAADEETFDMHEVGDRTIENELPKIALEEGKPVFVLHHSPVGLEYIEARGTALMFAGHTHAGQVFPGTLFAPLIFRLNRGLYPFEGMQVFVSQGAGTFGPRMRLGSRNMIHELTLVPE